MRKPRRAGCRIASFSSLRTIQQLRVVSTEEARNPDTSMPLLALRTLEMAHGMTIHVIHVSGKRMIAQGTDGCSRGSLMEGVMTGRDMVFVDLAHTAVERHPPLLDWVRTWTELPKLKPLTPEGWYEEGHGITGGTLDSHKVWIPMHGDKNELFLWAPQPPLADAVLEEELLKACHKRTDTFHVVLIPRLMTPRWRRLFNKIEISLSSSHLVPLSGPLTCLNLCGLALFSPSHTTGPGASRELHSWWRSEGTCKKCLLPVKPMRGIYCGNSSISRGRWPPCLSVWHAECYTSHGQMPSFPMAAIKDELGNPWHREEERQKRMMQGVEGAHLCIPFQCEVCWIRNLEGRDPRGSEDECFMVCIRRANLDAMAAKSPLTIIAHLRETMTVVNNASLINKTPSYHPKSPFPMADSPTFWRQPAVLLALR
jgi:hypothetical protein